MVLVQRKKIIKFGDIPNIQGAHAVFKPGKPSFKNENLLKYYSDREDSKCETFQSPPLQLTTVEEEVNQPCRQLTGQSSDKFAILREYEF